MSSEITPEGGDKRHPFFIGKLPDFYYRVSHRRSKNRSEIIKYDTPHEVILNLRCYRNSDLITYINRENNQELFTVNVDRFKVMIAESLYNVSHDDLELLYMRLILTNSQSKSIADRGWFRHLDNVLYRYLITLRGGYDSYLCYENRKVIFYLKYRRVSSIHLLAILRQWNTQNTDVNMNHINIPTTVNRQLVQACLTLELGKDRFRMYHYDPVVEDNIQPLTIDSEIIQVVNQLIK